jgi:hypothetical protein
MGDGRPQDQRASKNPAAPKGRKSHHPPWFFGIRFALRIVAWDVSRIPVACRIILPTAHPQDRTDNALCRDMLRAFKPPSWGEQVIVEGEAASGANATIALGTHRDHTDRSRDGHGVFALARTWKTVEDKARTTLGRHRPRGYDQRPWIPRLATWQHRKISWVSAPRLCLRAIGDVPVVRSKTGRTVSPDTPKLLVTTLPHVTARQVRWLDPNRGSVARVNRDLKSHLGLGEPQGRGGQDRLEKSCGIALLASLLVRRFCHHESTPGHPWRVSQLQPRLRFRGITKQVAQSVKVQRATRRKVASYFRFSRQGVGFE